MSVGEPLSNRKRRLKEAMPLCRYATFGPRRSTHIVRTSSRRRAASLKDSAQAEAGPNAAAAALPIMGATPDADGFNLFRTQRLMTFLQ